MWYVHARLLLVDYLLIILQCELDVSDVLDALLFIFIIMILTIQSFNFDGDRSCLI